MDTPTPTPTPAAAGSASPTVPAPGPDVRPLGAVAAGALTGFVAIVLVATARVVLTHAIPTFDESAWVGVLYLLVVAAVGAAGWVARRRSPGGTSVLVGAVAGAGALAAWVPVRIVIWVARDEQRGLLVGSDPALRVGPVLVNLGMALLVGAAGAWLADRSGPRRAPDVTA